MMYQLNARRMNWDYYDMDDVVVANYVSINLDQIIQDVNAFETHSAVNGHYGWDNQSYYEYFVTKLSVGNFTNPQLVEVLFCIPECAISRLRISCDVLWECPKDIDVLEWLDLTAEPMLDEIIQNSYDLLGVPGKARHVKAYTWTKMQRKIKKRARRACKKLKLAC